MTGEKTLSREYEIPIALGIVLSVLTCGLYNIYWNYVQFKAMNELLGRHEYDFVKWAVLTLVTCGIYHIYYEYKMGSDLYAYLRERGHQVNPNVQILGAVFAFLGLTVITDAIYQHELNRLIA